MINEWNLFFLFQINFYIIHGKYRASFYKDLFRGTTLENLQKPNKYNELLGLYFSGTFIDTDAIPFLFRNKQFLITSAGNEFSNIHVWFDMNSCESMEVSWNLSFFFNLKTTLMIREFV